MKHPPSCIESPPSMQPPMKHFSFLLLSLALTLSMASGGFGLADDLGQDQPIQFNRDIRPILSAACFRCHGLDGNKRQADLRLDVAEDAYRHHDGRQAIKPGDLADSEVWSRILSTDNGVVMPPPEATRQLSSQEKELLRRWIEQGAEYQTHWSFAPIKKGELPPSDAGLPHWDSAVDRYVLQAMKQQGLKPQPIADKGTLLRRLSLALTGLPPSISELTAFESDQSPEAYEKMVDRYLASPRYGQEMARHWLDVARYGDTHGLHLDNERSIWAYRDWVVEAFNRNQPYSDFSIEQLAGDLLPNPTPSQLVATGFNRCNVTTSEGGAIDEEFLFRYAVDRTSTTAEAWLGMTAGCAVCHDHKYDPLSTRDFYSLYAFFYSAADPAMDGNTNTTAPFYRPQSSQDRETLRQAEDQVKNAKKALFDAGARSAGEPSRVQVSQAPTDAVAFKVHDVWLDDELPVASSGRNTSRNAEVWTTNSSWQVPMGRRALQQSFGSKFEQTIAGGLVPRTVPEKAKLRAWVRLDAFEPSKAFFIELKSDEKTERWVWADDPDKASLVDAQPKQIVGALPKVGVWTLLERDLQGWKPGSVIQELKLGQWGGSLHWDGIVCLGEGRTPEDQRNNLEAWWASRVGKDTAEVDKELSDAIKAGPTSDLGKSRQSDILAFYRACIEAEPASEVLGARQAWYQSRIQLAMLQDSLPGTMVYRDTTKPRVANVMKRGQYDQKGDEVTKGTPAFLPAMRRQNLVSAPANEASPNPAKSNASEAPASPDASKQPADASRLDLARWLVSEDHPLTARVTVNRFWQQIFGTGIVLTSEDFGSQGSPPTHPELLDDLAFRFRSEGWNVKALIKEFVMSQAFRQQSHCTAEALAIDPANRWLSRGPRLRLDAEQIRDNVLAVSGLLDETMGGAGVKVYQPENIWEPVGYADSNTRYYLQDHGSALYRRSLYVFLKRTAPPPFMSNFDAPNREMFCARRERSNTPLQALQLMNDVQHVEAARHFGERMLREGGLDDASRIRYGFRLLLSRWPDEHELKVVMEALRGFQRKFATSPANAEELLAVGESASSATFAKTELAAYTLLGNLLFNLDETVNRN